MNTRFVRDESIAYDLDLGFGNLNFLLATSSHYALRLCEIRLNSLKLFLSCCGQTFDL